MSEYPEHDKMREIVHLTEAAGDFVEWLQERDVPVILCQLDVTGNHWTRAAKPLLGLLAEWQGIDLKKIEEEKRLMLKKQRELNDQVSSGGSSK